MKPSDIFRFKHETGIAGLFEVVEIIDNENIIVTNDECDSEQHAYTNKLIFVCSVDDRKDI